MGGVLGKRPRITPVTADIDGRLNPAGPEAANAKPVAGRKKSLARRGVGEESVRDDDGSRGLASNTVSVRGSDVSGGLVNNKVSVRGSDGSRGRTSTSVGGSNGRGTERRDGRDTDLDVDNLRNAYTLQALEQNWMQNAASRQKLQCTDDSSLQDPTKYPCSNQEVSTLATSSAKDKLTTSSSTSDTSQDTQSRPIGLHMVEKKVVDINLQAIKKMKGQGPLWKKTDDYFNELLKEIENLSISARLLKIPTFKISKADIIASYAADRLKLSQIKKEIECQEKNHARIPTCSLSRFCIKKNLKVSSTTEIVSSQFETSLDVKRQGCDLVIWQGSFAVPTICASGNIHLDRMNDILFDIWMAIDDILERRKLDAAFVNLFGETRRMARGEADRKAAVSTLRSTYRSIRLTILSLGALPLKEPLEYWRKTYTQLKF